MPHSNIGALMSAEHEIAAPVHLARLETVSPWQPTLPTSRARRWLAALAAAWREGMQLYVRAAMTRGYWGGWM
jgi:hypothetical protein